MRSFRELVPENTAHDMNSASTTLSLLLHHLLTLLYHFLMGEMETAAPQASPSWKHCADHVKEEV